MSTNSTLWHFVYGKGILTLAYEGQAITQGMAVSHKWVSYFRGAYSPWQMLNLNQYKWGQQSLDITFRNHCFLGLWYSIALVHVFITQIFIILGFMHSCMLKNTSFHECFKIFISLYFKADFIRLSLHSCMFKKHYFSWMGFL